MGVDMFFRQPAPRPNPLSMMLQSGAATLGQRYLENQQIQKENAAIQEAFKDLDENTSPMQVLTKIAGLNIDPEKKQMLYQGFQKISEKKHSQNQVRKLAERFEIPYEEVEGLTPQQVTDIFKMKKSVPTTGDLELLEDEMIKRGMPRGWARLYSKATEGGKTLILKDFLEAKKRLGEGGISEKEVFPEVPPSLQPQQPPTEGIQQAPNEQIPTQGLNANQTESSDRVKDYDVGLTPQERIARQSERYKVQTPIVEEINNKIKALEDESLKISRLGQLNQGPGLPSGLARWNVTQTGDLRFPFMASPEAQLFVKTVQEFLANAKDTFGARVTNFDVDQYKKRLPGLMNTPEGRELIIEQMKIINELNQLEPKSVIDQFEKHGGIRNVDYTQALSLGKKDIKARKKDLIQEFMNVASKATEFEKATQQEAEDKATWAKKRAAPGYIVMQTPEGEMKYVKKESVNEKKKLGYKTL